MPQLASTAIHRALAGYFRCPYQANVMNTFDAIRSTIGVTKGLMAGSSAYGVMVRE